MRIYLEPQKSNYKLIDWRLGYWPFERVSEQSGISYDGDVEEIDHSMRFMNDRGKRSGLSEDFGDVVVHFPLVFVVLRWVALDFLINYPLV